MNQDVEIVIGPPGTGKTTYCLNLIEDALDKDHEPNEIGFFSFTRKAANEAIERACEKFKFTPRDLPYFRTLHSLAYRELRLSNSDVMSKSAYKTIGDLLGLNFTGIREVYEMTTVMVAGSDGDRIMAIEALSRIRNVPLREEYDRQSEYDISFLEIQQYADTLKDYKEKYNVLDFVDMINQVMYPINARLIIFDEAQDMTNQQFKMAEVISSQAAKVIYAGDDMQAIYEWAGADVEGFKNLEGEKKVLPKSYRLPSEIADLAKTVEQRVPRNYNRVWESREDEGSVNYITFLDEIDFSEGEWLLLGRNRYQLTGYAEEIRYQGYAYTLDGKSSTQDPYVKAVMAYEKLRKDPTKIDEIDDIRLVKEYMGIPLDEPLNLKKEETWMEALKLLPPEHQNYIRQIKRNGEQLSAVPRITISTIHGSKGGEADNVVIRLDMSKKTYDGYLQNPDIEMRVFYTGITRAKENLYIIEPRGKKYFEYL